MSNKEEIDQEVPKEAVPEHVPFDPDYKVPSKQEQQEHDAQVHEATPSCEHDQEPPTE